MEKSVMNQLCIEGMAVDGETAWFAAATFNGFFRMDFKDYSVEYIAMFSDEPVRKPGLYSVCCIYGDEVLFIPFFAHNLYIYNVVSHKTDKYVIDVPKWRGDNWGFYVYCQKNEYVYMVSCRQFYIVRFNMITKEIKVYDKWYGEFQKRYPFINYPWVISSEICEYDDKIYIPCYANNVIIVFDILEDRISFAEINNDIRGICTICRAENYFVISTVNGEFFRGDLQKDRNVWFRYISVVKGRFCKSFYENGEVCFFPENAGNIYKLNLSNGKLEKMLKNEIVIDETKQNAVSSYYLIYNSYQCFMLEKIRPDRYVCMLCNGNLYEIAGGEIREIGKIYCSQGIEPLKVMEGEQDTKTYTEIDGSMNIHKGDILGNSLYAFCEYTNVYDRKGQNRGKEPFRYGGCGIETDQRRVKNAKN